jgi:hypothetical protein
MNPNLKLATAAATDATNRRSRMAGRTEWNQADWNFYCSEVERLFPLDTEIERLRESARERMA